MEGEQMKDRYETDGNNHIGDIMNRRIWYDIKISIVGLNINVAIVDHFFAHVQSIGGYVNHDHAGFEVQYMLCDNDMLINNVPVQLKAGDFVLIAPLIPHKMYANAADAKRMTFLYSVYNDGKHPQNASLASKLIGVNDFCVVKDNKGELYSIMQRIQKELQDQDLFYYEKAKCEFESFFIQFARQMEYNVSQKDKTLTDTGESMIQRIEDYINFHFSQDTTREDLAKYLNISVQQLKRLLDELYGKSFREMLLERRMAYAKYYVEDTIMPLNEVPYHVGYGSVSAFYLAYKKFYGVTPGGSRGNMS